MRILFGCFFVLICLVPALSQARPSFNCSTAKLPAEITICRVSNLAELDAKMARSYAEIIRAVSADLKRRIQAEQRAWLQRRNECASDIACLLQVFSERHLEFVRLRNALGAHALTAASQPSFECSARSSPTENAICDSDALATADRRLDEAYRSALDRAAGGEAASLKQEQRAWLSNRNACGADSDCLRREMEGRIATLDGTKPTSQPSVSRPVRQATKDAAQCAQDTDVLKRAAAAVTLAVKDQSVRTDEAIGISWRRDAWRLPQNTSVYLLLVFPEWVRFTGEYLLPLPPGAPAPDSLAVAKDQMRVVLPLTSVDAPSNGAIGVKAYRAQALDIEMVVVSKSSCGETVLLRGPLASIEILDGPPEMVLQDFYSTEGPGKTVVSNDGRFRLEINPGSWRAFDTATGAKIADRVGIRPNFSPGCRFVGAYVGVSGSDHGAQLEVFDLIAGKPIDNLPTRGQTIGWAFNDGLLFDGTGFSPELAVHRTLIDPPSEVTETSYIKVDSGKGYAWDHFDIAAISERGIVLIRGGPDGASIFELASSRLRESSLPLHAAGIDVTREAILHALAIEGGQPAHMAKGWNADGPIRLSHIDEDVEFGIANREERFAGTEPQKKYLVQHSGTAPAGSVDGGILKSVVAGDWKPRSARATPAANEVRQVGFVARLAEFGVCIYAECKEASDENAIESLITSGEYRRIKDTINWEYVANFNKHPGDLQAAMVREVPAVRENLASDDEAIGFHNFSDGSDHRTRKVKLRISSEPQDQGGMNGLWHWSANGHKFWLAQQVYGWRGDLHDSSVVLLAGADGTDGSIINLSAADRADNDTEGLHKNFFGDKDDQLVRIRPFLFDDRWLLIASPAGASAAIVDLTAPDEPKFVYGLLDIYDARWLGRTADGRQIVQLNNDGTFHIYEAASGTVVISGRYIDGEIVLFTREGYFWSSYEGAHYAHVRFGGREGLYALDQFASVLNRPDIVKTALARTGFRAAPPQIAAPPSIDVAFRQNGTDAVALDFDAKSLAGLSEIRIYQDGVRSNAVPVSGNRVTNRIEVVPAAHTRWITAVAVDATGLTSIPVSLELRDRSPSGTLHVTAVGIDDYQNLDRLDFAKVDANTIAAAIQTAKGRYYHDVKVTLLRDREASATSVLKTLGDQALAAREEDTLMLFFAGHGARSADGRFYAATSETLPEDIEHTALGWHLISNVLARTKARVVVVLDACHAGQTGAQVEASNDGAVSALAADDRKPILVMAASKGREGSFEMPGQGGGVFTQLFSGAIGRDRESVDLNKNGAIEISELYRVVKRGVAEITDSEQTPWLVRQGMIGDFALF